MKRLHAIVSGRVQGVGYREFTRRHAVRLGVRGWVRNCPDGTVEVLAEGEDAVLAQLHLALEKGPALADIDKVDATYHLPTGEFTAFIVRS